MTGCFFQENSTHGCGLVKYLRTAKHIVQESDTFLKRFYDGNIAAMLSHGDQTVFIKESDKYRQFVVGQESRCKVKAFSAEQRGQSR